MLTDIHAAGAGRPKEGFVAGEADHIDVHRDDVDRHQPSCLSGIDGKENTAFATDAADLGHRLDGANDVGSMVHDNQRGVGADSTGDIVRIDISPAVEGHEIDLNALFPVHVHRP